MPSIIPVTPETVVPPTDLQNLITAPQRVRTDEGTVEERPIDQLLQGDVYNRLDAGNQAAAKTIISRWGISVARTRPPDALGQQRPDPFGPRFL